MGLYSCLTTWVTHFLKLSNSPNRSFLLPSHSSLKIFLNTAFSQTQRRRIVREKAVGVSSKRNLVEISNPDNGIKEGQVDNTKRRCLKPRVNFHEVSSNLQDFKQAKDTITREEGDFKVQLDATETPPMRVQIVQPSIQNSEKGGCGSEQVMPSF